MNNISARFYPYCTYSDSLVLQDKVREKVRTTPHVFIMGFEYGALITLGRSAEKDQEVFDESLPVFKTDRGGKATLHSQGQLVVYPILDLKEHHIGVQQFVHLVLKSSQEALLHFGVRSDLDLCNAGLYVEGQKIAFVGLRITEGVSKHGVSINVKNDINLFKKIRVCGQNSPQLTSIKEILDEPVPSLEQVFYFWVECFKRNLYESQLRSLGAVGSAFP